MATIRSRQGFSQAGFTLLELLISLAIFAIMSVMAYSGLQMVLDAKERTEQQADTLIALQTAFTFLTRDIEQTMGRSVRDGFGDAVPALVGGGFGPVMLEVTRAGVRNPIGLARSNLQRVSYRYEDKKLIRQIFPSLDQGPAQEPFSRALLSNVKKFEIRFLDSQLAWSDGWPSDKNGDYLIRLPRAVEITLDVEGFGKIKRLFRVPPGQSVVTLGSNPASSGAGSTGTGSPNTGSPNTGQPNN